MENQEPIMRLFKEYGQINPRQADALIISYEQDSISYTNLRDKLGIKNPGQFSESIISKLRHLGYIQTPKNPDKKTKQVIITKKGKDLVEKVLAEKK